MDFPFGLPLPVHGEETVPIDISVNFRDIPSPGKPLRERSRGNRLNSSSKARLASVPGTPGQEYTGFIITRSRTREWSS